MVKNQAILGKFQQMLNFLTQKGVSTKKTSKTHVTKPKVLYNLSVLTPVRRKNILGRYLTPYASFRDFFRLSRINIRFDPKKIPKPCLRCNLTPLQKFARGKFLVGINVLWACGYMEKLSGINIRESLRKSRNGV